MSLRESKLAKTDQSVRSSDSGSAEEDFLASDKDSVLLSDLSHLGSISVYSDVSDIFTEATNKDPELQTRRKQVQRVQTSAMKIGILPLKFQV
jgi:hypothetical protein